MSAIFMTGVLLATIELAGAANTPAAVSAAGLNNQVNSGTAEASKHWAADTSNGCKVWSPEPIASEITVRWSGRCENDFAQGPGTVRWLNNNKQVAELTGTMEQGKIRGRTTGVEEPGNRIDGMFIDSLPEGEGKASFADGSSYSGEWHRGRQLGYGMMTFPPAHPQYKEMLNDGKGRRTENGIYVLRGWWEGKTFVMPCDSEDECEKAVVAQMKREQAAAAAKAGTPLTPVPAATVIPATEPAAAPAIPAPATPVTVPVPTTSAPDTGSAPAATAPAPELPMGPAVAPSMLAPATLPAEPVSGPAAVPAETAPALDLPVMEPAVVPPTPAPETPAAEPASDPAAPAVPDVKPTVVPEAATPATPSARSEAPLLTKHYTS